MTASWVALAFLVTSCVIREDNGLARVLRLPILAKAGAVSYGMYLLNTIVVKSVESVTGVLHIAHPLVSFPIVTILTFLAASASYKYFESYFLGLKQQFASNQLTSASAA